MIRIQPLTPAMATCRTFLALVWGSLIVIGACAPRNSSIGHSVLTQWKDDKRAAISITYDDATINQFRKALPIMDSLGFQGTFFINTADIPGSKYPPKFIGRPIDQIVGETADENTHMQNLFERASALRFLNIEGAVEKHNSAGSLYEQGELEEAYRVIDEAYRQAREKDAVKENRPVLLQGERITWDELSEFAARGHEFGSHTISHPRLAVLDEENLLYELEKCKEEIASKLGEKHTFSAECPFGTEDERVMEYALKIHPALRNRMPAPYLEELNRWNQNPPGISTKEYVQWQRGPLQKNSLEEMKSWVDTLLVHDNIWLVLTFHGIDGIGWEAKPSEELREYFSYMKAKEDAVWVTTFGEATKYMRERMNARLTSTVRDGGIEISLRHDIDPETYAVPLTIKSYVNEAWQDVSVRQGSTTLEYQSRRDGNGPYILFNAFPNIEMIIIEGTYMTR